MVNRFSAHEATQGEGNYFTNWTLDISSTPTVYECVFFLTGHDGLRSCACVSTRVNQRSAYFIDGFTCTII